MIIHGSLCILIVLVVAYRHASAELQRFKSVVCGNVGKVYITCRRARVARISTRYHVIFLIVSRITNSLSLIFYSLVQAERMFMWTRGFRDTRRSQRLRCQQLFSAGRILDDRTPGTAGKPIPQMTLTLKIRSNFANKSEPRLWNRLWINRP